MDPELQGGTVDSNVANEVVGENLDLGLSADDLGLNSENVFEDLDLEQDLPRNDLDDLSSEPVVQQNNQQQQQRQQQPQNNQQHRPLPQHSLVKPDGKGNLVDVNGQIVARAGAEARNYQKFAKHFEAPLRAAATQLSQYARAGQDAENRLSQAVEIGTQLAQKVRELSATQNQNNLGQQFGLSQDEMIQAATFARQAKSDPASAIKSILTMAAARGIDLKSVLGPNAPGGGIDIKAITDLIKGEIANVVKPIQDRTAQEQQQQEQRVAFNNEVTRIQNEARSFFERTPDAVPFLEAFRAIKTDPNLRHLDMGHIWSEIQLRLARGGHTPQSYINAMRSRQQNPNGGTMPQGRQRGSIAPPQANNIGQNEMAPVSMSYEQIVRDLLRST